MATNEVGAIDLTATQRAEVVAMLERYVPNTEVWAYGSRVKFSAQSYSDLDLVVFSSPEQSVAVYELREAFDAGSLPFRVDLFVWDELPERFHKTIREHYVVLQRKTEAVAEASERNAGKRS